MLWLPFRTSEIADQAAISIKSVINSKPLGGPDG
jgi:hypothetical protein